MLILALLEHVVRVIVLFGRYRLLFTAAGRKWPSRAAMLEGRRGLLLWVGLVDEAPHIVDLVVRGDATAAGVASFIDRWGSLLVR